MHVDGVAAIGGNWKSVRSTIEQVHQRLEANHLKCKGVNSDSLEQKFTGLNFDFETGGISVSQGRIWKLRLALLEVAERGFCSGDGMLSLLGHYTLGRYPAPLLAWRLPRRLSVRSGRGTAAVAPLA